jgi:hypothetical protein
VARPAQDRAFSRSSTGRNSLDHSGDAASCSSPNAASRGGTQPRFVRREDAERFIDEVSGDDRDLASNLRIVESERAETSTTTQPGDGEEPSAVGGRARI